MALIRCKEVSEGLRISEATVTLEEYHGANQYLPIDRGVLSEVGGHVYLSVAVIHRDEAKEAALVALPVEADSGANRIWVKSDDLIESPASKEFAR